MTLARTARRAVLTLLLVAGSGHAATFTVPGTTANVDASGWVDGLAIAKLGGPRQRPQALGELSLLGKITRDLRTQLTLRGMVGGPYVDGHPGIMSLVHEFQNHTPSAELNEAWAEYRLGDAQIRAGIQKFAWGKLDGTPPTDVLSPRDLHDPLVRDIEESKIGIPAVQLTYYLPPVPAIDLSELRASLVYIPFATISRIALTQERWFPPTINQAPIVIPKSILGDAGPLRIPLDLRTQNARPPTQLDDGGIAFRLSGTVKQVDWSVAHYTGPEVGPDLSLITYGTRNPHQSRALGLRVLSYVRQAHDVVHMTGADFSTPLGGATVRGEVAVFQDRPYLRDSQEIFDEAIRNPVVANRAARLISGDKNKVRIPVSALFPDRDSVEWGIGFDYLIGGFLPLLQLNQVIFTDNGPEQLLSNPDTRLLGSVRKGFFQDALELEVRGVYEIERGAWFVFPRATYRFGDHLRLRAGYLGIGGNPVSMIGQFRANDEFVFEARYSF